MATRKKKAAAPKTPEYKAPKVLPDPNNNPEEDHTLSIVVLVKGFGRKEHQLREAAEVRRILEVKLHREVPTFLVEDDIMEYDLPFLEVKRDDRNALSGAP